MKIAMFTDTYAPQINGVVTSIQAFRAELERQGHEVHIFAPMVSEKALAESNVHRMRAFTFAPYPEYKVSVPNLKIIEEFERIHADIIHIHTPISVGAVGLGLARHFRLPTVGTFHTLLPEYLHYIVKGGFSIFKRPVKHLAWDWCSWFYNRCDAVIAPSSAITTLLKIKGVKKPIYEIPTGIAKPPVVSTHAKAAFRKKLKLSGKVILHVGRVTREKNIEAIIDCMNELDGVTLAVASDGPHRANLQHYVKQKGLTKRIKFLGYLSKDELAAAYAAVDLFVCASQSETQGIVLLEAASAGTPIVALDAPVVSEFVRENKAGIVASKEHFARTIRNALGDEKLKARSRNRAKAIAKKYDIVRCTRKLVGIYEQVEKRNNRAQEKFD